MSEILIAPWSTLRTSSGAIRTSGAGSPFACGGGDRHSPLVKALSDGSIDKIIEFAAKVPSEECEVFIPQMEGAEPRDGECDGHHFFLRLCQPQHGNWSPHALPHCTNDYGCCGTLVARTTPRPGVAGICHCVGGCCPFVAFHFDSRSLRRRSPSRLPRRAARTLTPSSHPTALLAASRSALTTPPTVMLSLLYPTQLGSTPCPFHALDTNLLNLTHSFYENLQRHCPPAAPP